MKLGQFHDKEFAQMMYSPAKIPEGTGVLSFYKDLSKVKEFRLDPGEGIENNKLMVYILLMYDKNSPYRTKYSDPLKRKVEIAHDAGFELIEGGIFEAPVEDFLRGRNAIVNRKISAYVRLHRSYKYAFQVMIESSYYNLMEEILGGEMKNFSKARDLKDELENNLLELLNQDNNPILKDEILRYMEAERLALRPEDIAKKLQDGEKPV